MNTQWIETFLMVVKENNVTKAAEVLGFSQPTVTFQIKQLENELDVKLFEKSGTRLRLTAKGEEYAEYARKIMFQINESGIRLHESDESVGYLRIGCPESLASCVLPHAVDLFTQKCTNCSVKIVTETAPVLMNMLDQNEIDILYMFSDKIESKNWIRVCEKEERVLFVASPEDELAKKKVVRMEEIGAHQLILSHTRSSLSYIHKVYDVFSRNNILLQPKIIVDNTEVIVNLIRQQVGISVLPYYAVKDYLAHGILCEVHAKELKIDGIHQLFYHKEKKKSSAMKIMLEIMREAVLSGS